MKQKKIFIDFHYLKNLNKGFGQFCLGLGKGLSKQSIDDLNLTFYSPLKWKYYFNKKIQHKSSFDFHRYFSLKKEYDIWHNVTHLSRIEPDIKSNTKIIYTIHDVIFAILGRTGKTTENHYKNLQSKIDRSAGLVYISEYTRATVQQNFTIPEHVKQYVIYNGNPLENVAPIKSNKYSLPYILCVGEFRGYKNQEALLPMLNYLDKDLKIIFVGKYSKNQKEKIHALIEKHHLNGRIILKGTVSKSEKIKLYSNAKALVHPSLAEGFGLPVVEAMSFGTPVIISQRTSLPEIGGDVAGYWTNYNPEYMAKVVKSTINKFNQDPEQQKRALKEQASKFSWKETARQYLQVYREL